MSEHQAVLFSNEAFYAAFASRDMAAMADVWAESADVCVIHPGWEPIYGREAVMESWRAILEGAQSPEIRERMPKALVNDTVATVVCYEEISGNFLMATNIFVKQSGRWRMFHHHAAPTNGRPSEVDALPDSIN
jgi:ketosteroid isomerase-like protein